MNKLTLQGGGTPPDYIEHRRCPKDNFHWKTEGERCPVCKSKIVVTIYTPRQS